MDSTATTLLISFLGGGGVAAIATKVIEHLSERVRAKARTDLTARDQLIREEAEFRASIRQELAATREELRESRNQILSLLEEVARLRAENIEKSRRIAELERSELQLKSRIEELEFKLRSHGIPVGPYQ
jgi:septal ring factor EnvC (AmiA/AmiB activator)